jgi:hypothetical protein
MGSDEDRVWSHSGGDPGVATMVIINPDDQTGVIFLSNGNWRRSRAYDAMFQQLFALAGAGVTQ